uniref:hypothetical protein n=1 Tax=Helicobacter japonicus TaxID=425400 RepID=UPI0023F106FF
PLYSNLKSKIESKGLYPIIIGLVACCSSIIIYWILSFLFLKFYNFISGIELLFFGLSIFLVLSFLYKSTLIISFYALLSIICVLFVGEASSIMFIVFFALFLFCVISFILVKKARYDVFMFVVYLCMWLGFIFLFFHLYIRL